MAVAIFLTAVALAFHKNVKPAAILHPPVVNKNNDGAFNELVLNAAGSVKSYPLSGINNFISISATINIDKDSFYINGNGTILVADSFFKDPVFNITPAAKQIVIDSVVFKDFDVAILVHNNNVVLKNVRFINCRVPVQYALSLPDTIISGRFTDSVFVNNLKAH